MPKKNRGDGARAFGHAPKCTVMGTVGVMTQKQYDVTEIKFVRLAFLVFCSFIMSASCCTVELHVLTTAIILIMSRLPNVNVYSS